MKTSWQKKDLLGIKSLCVEEINHVLELARTFKADLKANESNSHILQGRTIANFFMQPSTRTRASFEMAAHKLGAKSIYLEAGTSSLRKGESILDTALNLQAIGIDAIVLRQDQDTELFHELAQELQIPLINAGDDTHEHPSQALLDAFTLLEKMEQLKDKKIAILGDVELSRVARSNLILLEKFGAKTLLLQDEAANLPNLLKDLKISNAKLLDTAEAILEEADAVMLLRRGAGKFSPHEQSNDKGHSWPTFQLTKEHLELMKPEAFILHPGPMIRGGEIHEEIAADLLKSEKSLILDQAANGVPVRMAILKLCLENSKSQEGR